MRRAALLSFLLLVPPAEACPRCRPLVRAAVYGAGFLPNLALVLLPIPLLVAGAALLGRAEREG